MSGWEEEKEEEGVRGENRCVLEIGSEMRGGGVT